MTDEIKDKQEEFKILIIEELADNFLQTDEEILEKILKRAIKNALNISNRQKTLENIDLLEDEIISYTKTVYLQRGTEDVKNLSTSGKSSTFTNAKEEMKKSIIEGGKRLLK